MECRMAGRLKAVLANSSSRLTILVITPCYDEPKRTMGSVPKICRELSKYARVVVFSGGSSTRIENRSPSLQVRFFKELLIPDPVNNGFIPGMFSKFQKTIDEVKPDVVLNVKHMFTPNLLVPYAKHKGYRVVTATDTFPGINWFSPNPVASAAMWMYARTFGLWVLRASDNVILFHDALVKYAKRLKLHASVIPNGVELDLMRSAKPKKLAGKINIIYVGRLESVKGYQTILNAALSITQKHSDIHFYHVGDDKGKEKIITKYSSPQMHFEGRKNLSETYSYLKGAQIGLLASKSEGLPNVVMEGMAAGCVTVSTPVGAVPSLLENGKLGRLFPYENTAALVHEIEWLINHPKERIRMAALGKRKIERDYNWKKLGIQYSRLLLGKNKV